MGLIIENKILVNLVQIIVFSSENADLDNRRKDGNNTGTFKKPYEFDLADNKRAVKGRFVDVYC